MGSGFFKGAWPVARASGGVSARLGRALPWFRGLVCRLRSRPARVVQPGPHGGRPAGESAWGPGRAAADKAGMQPGWWRRELGRVDCSCPGRLRSKVLWLKNGLATGFFFLFLNMAIKID